jgi:hypothetical protein
MLIVIVTCLVLVALTTLVHYEVLRGLHVGLPKLHIHNRTKLLIAMFAAFFAHALEIALYALAFFLLITFRDVGTLSGPGQTSVIDWLYFSAETYTSLGLGDIAPSGPLRLLAGAEALNGLLLIAWSASYAYISMEQFWSTGAVDQRDR